MAKFYGEFFPFLMLMFLAQLLGEWGPLFVIKESTHVNLRVAKGAPF